MSNLAKKRIDSIQGIRFCAALFVSLFHFGIISPLITGQTIFDVKFFINLFFCISGFFVMMSTEKQEKRKLFLTRRFIRLLPLYWALTFATFAAGLVLPDLIEKLLGYAPSFEQFIKSLFCIPFARDAMKAESAIRPIVGLGHTLQMEVAFSIVFTIAMRISHKYRAVIASAIAIIFAIMGRIFNFENVFLRFYLYINWSSWLFFVVGICCFYIIRRLSKMDKIPNLFFAVWSVVTVAVLIVPQFLFDKIKTYDLSQYVQIIICLFLVIEVILIDKKGFRTPKLITHLGNTSFSYYLIHYYIVRLAEKFLHIDNFSAKNIVLMVAVIAVAWVVAYISYFIIENKFGTFLTNKVNKLAKK